MLLSTPFLSLGETSRVTIFVKQEFYKVKKLLSVLERVSDPHNPDYGKFLTHEQVVDLQRPQPKDLLAVEQHIASLGGTIVSRSIAGDKLTASFPSHFSKLVPTPITTAVDMVCVHEASGSNFAPKLRKQKPAPLRQRVNKDNPQSCLADRVTPPCLRTAYGLGDLVGTQSNNSQAVVVNQGFKPADLSAFVTKYQVLAKSTVHTVGKNSGDAGDEATLDLEYITRCV